MTFSRALLTGAVLAFTTAGAAQAASAKQPWKADANGDARLSRAEYQDDFAKRILRYDKNGDGVIDQAEIDAAATQAANRARARTAKLFSLEDTDKDGKVTRAELEAAAGKRFTGLDADGDGMLAREDLRRRRAKAEDQSSSTAPN